MQLQLHIWGSSIYFVKSEQVLLLPCLLRHSFLLHLYYISSSLLFPYPLFFEESSPLLNMMMTARSAVPCRLLWEGWKSLRPFPRFPQFVVAFPVGRVGKSTDLFHAFHSSSFARCGKGGKVYGPFPRFPQSCSFVAFDLSMLHLPWQVTNT